MLGYILFLVTAACLVCVIVTAVRKVRSARKEAAICNELLKKSLESVQKMNDELLSVTDRMSGNTFMGLLAASMNDTAMKQDKEKNRESHTEGEKT